MGGGYSFYCLLHNRFTKVRRQKIAINFVFIANIIPTTFNRLQYLLSVYVRPPGEMIQNSVIVRDAMPSSKMADDENTNMEIEEEKKRPLVKNFESFFDKLAARTDNNVEGEKDSGESCTTTEYCGQLQTWMWQYYTGYVNWQSWLAASALPCPYTFQPASGTPTIGSQNWYHGPHGLALSSYPPANTSRSSRAGEAAAGRAAVSAQPQQLPREHGNAQRPGLCLLSLLGLQAVRMKMSVLF